MAPALVGISVGVPEVIIILVVVLIVFGPSKLPQLGESVGKMLRGFKKEIKSLDDEKAEAKGEIDEDKKNEHRDEIDVTPKSAADGTKG